MNFKINPYFYDRLEKTSNILPAYLREKMLKQAEEMTQIGVNSEETHKAYIDIALNVPKIAKQLSNKKLSQAEITKIAQDIFESKSDNLYESVFNILAEMEIPMKKFAYPSGDVGAHLDRPHYLPRWMEAMKTIYGFVQQGAPYNQALNHVTSNWDIMEKQDFQHWLSFYEENAHKKYKTAQYSEVPLDILKSQLPKPYAPEVEQFPALTQPLTEAQKKEEVKKKIKAIIGRLNSAEKIATEPEIQRELQKCLDIGVLKWLEQLQHVKRMIQLAPMKSAHSTILEDLIYKQANILEHQGYPKAAKLMNKIAQMSELKPDSSAPPMMTGNIMGGPGQDDGEAAMKELIQGMNNEVPEEDENQSDDLDALASIVVTAQPVPEPVALPEVPTEAPALEVSEDEIPEPIKVDPFDAALANITVQDIIDKLESVANIFRTREISRQLSEIDLMMDKLEIASFFPSLAEANSKSLESNQYALTRIEDIISKLRGSVETPAQNKVELKGDIAPGKPVPPQNPEAVKANLSKEMEAEKARKEQRKKEELKPVPEAKPVPQELNQPVQVQPPVPKPAV